MADLIFYTDYGPLLARAFKSAFILYVYYDKFKDDKNIVQFTYNDLTEHLGLASSTIQKANAALKLLKLIEEMEENSSGKKYKLLPISELSEATINGILTKASINLYNPKTNLRKRYLEDNIPHEFQQLLNKKLLRKAKKELGDSFKKLKPLCKYLNIDHHHLKIICERDKKGAFTTKLKTLLGEVESEGKPKESKVLKRQISPEARELTKYLYDKLIAYGVTPLSNWFPKNQNVAQGLIQGGLSLEEGRDIIDWGFNDSWWADKLTEISILNTLKNKYQLSKHKNVVDIKISRKKEIPLEIRNEISEISQSLQVKTYEDAYMLKESFLSGTNNKQILEAVLLLESKGILPQGQQNISFGR